MVKAVVVAAFKVTEDKSVAYRKYQTPEAAGKAIANIITFLEPDYISVRIIKEHDKK